VIVVGPRPGAGPPVDEYRPYGDAGGVEPELSRRERHERAGGIDEPELEVGETDRNPGQVADFEPVADLGGEERMYVPDGHAHGVAAGRHRELPRLDELVPVAHRGWVVGDKQVLLPRVTVQAVLAAVRHQLHDECGPRGVALTESLPVELGVRHAQEHADLGARARIHRHGEIGREIGGLGRAERWPVRCSGGGTRGEDGRGEHRQQGHQHAGTVELGQGRTPGVGGHSAGTLSHGLPGATPAISS